MQEFVTPPPPSKVQMIIAIARKHWWLTITGGFLLLSAVLLLITPQGETVVVPPASFVAEQSDFPAKLTTIRYTGPSVSLPDEIGLYSAAATESGLVNVAESIAEAEQLSKFTQSSIENFWTNTDQSITVDIRNNNQKLMFVKDQSFVADVEVPGLLLTAPAVEAAQTFLTTVAQIPYLTPLTDEISYHSGETDASAQNASAIVIPFTFSIDGIPVQFAGSHQTLARVFVNKQYQVIKAELYPPLPTPQLTESVQPISLESAIAQIKNKNAQIISAGSATYYDVQLEEITNLELKQAQLEYRFDPQNRLYYPYLSFSGQATTENDPNLSYTLTVITPAIPIAAQAQ